MRRSLDLSRSTPGFAEPTDVPLAGTRRQTMHRLQVGIGGVLFMILLVGLASLIQTRTREVDLAATPAAAPTTEPTGDTQQNDPLVEAGVVPDLPAEPAPQPSQSPAAVPQQVTPDVPPPSQ